jgi:hypothetical protein
LSAMSSSEENIDIELSWLMCTGTMLPFFRLLLLIHRLGSDTKMLLPICCKRLAYRTTMLYV